MCMCIVPSFADIHAYGGARDSPVVLLLFFDIRGVRCNRILGGSVGIVGFT